MGENESKVMTLEELYDVLRQEKYHDELQELDKRFYDSIRSYISDKNDMLSVGGSFSDRESINSEIKTIRRIVKEIYHRREKKIISMAQNKSRTGSSLINTASLLTHEADLFNRLVDVLKGSQEKVIKELISIRSVSRMSKKINYPNPPKKQEKKEEGVKLRFNEDIDQFVGVDMKTHGPFKKGEEERMDKDTAKMLINSKKAVEI